MSSLEDERRQMFLDYYSRPDYESREAEAKKQVYSSHNLEPQPKKIALGIGVALVAGAARLTLKLPEVPNIADWAALGGGALLGLAYAVEARMISTDKTEVNF